MAASYRRNLTVTQNNVNLYCAQCESQIGIFNNEWIRLTTSYARSKEKGTHFGTEVGHRTQVVPQGPAQRSAEGCVMAEVFCCKCSNMVGQYCKSAPDAGKQSLVDQYFYKLTRTHLKDCRTHVKVEPVFGYGSDMVKSTSSTSSMFPRSSMAPTSRWADTPMRQSSRTPALSLPESKRSSTHRESRSSPLITIDTVDRKWEDRWEQSRNELRILKEGMTAQRVLIQDQSEKLSAQSQRLDDQELRLKDQAACVEEHETCMSAQANHIVEQDQLIENQSKRLENQQAHMSAITDQLKKLQKTMDDLRNMLSSSTLSQTQINSRSVQSLDTDTVDLESVLGALKKAEDSVRELQSLRAENGAMKLRLHTIASAMGSSSEHQPPPDTNAETPLLSASDPIQVLGKRKRNAPGRPSSLGLNDPAVRFQDNTEQMPTPQASDGGHQSPEQTPSVSSTRRSTTNNNDTNHESGQSVLETMTTVDHEMFVDISAGDNDDAIANDTYNQQIVSLNNGQEEDQHSRSESIGKGPAHRTRRRSSISTAKVRRSGRVSKARDVMETSDAHNGTSNTERASADGRRITRSATKGPESKTSDDDQLEQAADHDVDSSTAASSMLDSEARPYVDNDLVFQQPPLSSVQSASNVLGINLEALIVSSQAVKQGLMVQQKDAESATATTSTTNHATPAIQEPLTTPGPIGQARETIGDIHSDAVQLVKSARQSAQVEFVEDFSAHDIIDSSDDDDDLMQPDAALYGDDSLDADNIQLPEGEIPDANRTGLGIDMTIPRIGRSMAPEPTKPKKAPTVRTYISLDRIHIATPHMFTEAYAAGRQPKAAKPAPIQSREQHLNEELKQLGLSEWIGKNKNCKEYRDLVNAARARFRNSKKAAFLKKKGLNYNLSDPSSVLPEGPVRRATSAPQGMPRTNVEDVPGPARSAMNEMESVSATAEGDEQGSTDRSRATRARSRRSSVPLVSGLEEVGIQPSSASTKQPARKRKSGGNRRGTRTSDNTFHEEDLRTQSDHQRTNEDTATSESLMNDAVTATTTSDQHDTEHPSKRRKSSGMPRVGSRKSAAAEPLPAPLADQREKSNSAKAATLDVQALSSHPPTTTPNTTESTVGSEMVKQINLKAQAQQRREEAILLRDRIAKELMEREMMEL